MHNPQLMTNRGAFRHWLLALVLSAIAVVVSIAQVDRIPAEFIEARLRPRVVGLA
jgi:hypothetical protein